MQKSDVEKRGRRTKRHKIHIWTAIACSLLLVLLCERYIDDKQHSTCLSISQGEVCTSILVAI